MKRKRKCVVKKYKFKKQNHKFKRLLLFFKDCKRKKFYSCNFAKSRGFKGHSNNSTFKNVNFRGAIFTKCSFKNSTFINVEFMGSNLKGTNFTNSKFKHCIFSATLLKNTNFFNCEFENCIFIATNTNLAKNLMFDKFKNTVLPTHMVIQNLELETLELFGKLKFIPELTYSRVLYLKNGKLNSLTINMLVNKFTEYEIQNAINNILSEMNHINFFKKVITSFQFILLIDKFKNKSANKTALPHSIERLKSAE
mgnify:CR=1 FL=1